MSSIRITFDNRVEDHIRASKLYYTTTFFHKADKVVAVLLLLSGIFITLLIGIHWWSIIFILLPLIEWFNLLSVNGIRTRFWFRKNPKFLETYELTFDEERIHFITQSIDSDIEWTYYYQLLEDEQVFLLMYGQQQYSVFPKRAFADANEMDVFRELVHRKIASKLQQK